MKKDEPRVPYNQRTSQEFLDSIRDCTAEWLIPWKKGMGEAPYNPITGKAYSGINSLVLSSAKPPGDEGNGATYPDKRWMTYRQAQSIGCQVKYGPKSTRTIMFWPGPKTVENKDTGELETEYYRRPIYSSVFNGSEILGLPEYKPVEPTWEPNARADDLIQASGALIEHRNGNRAFYAYASDRIVVPEMGQFDEMEHYYATVTHELGHWTSSKDRCDREIGRAGFGSPEYAFEELVAELSAHFTCRNLALDRPGVDEQHKAYLKSWMTILADDPDAILRAAALAEKATRFLMQFDRYQAQDQALIEARKIEPIKRAEEAQPEQHQARMRTKEARMAGASR